MLNGDEEITKESIRLASDRGWFVVTGTGSSFLKAGEKILIVADRDAWSSAKSSGNGDLPTFFPYEVEQIRLSAKAVSRGEGDMEKHLGFARTIVEAKKVFEAWVLPETMVRHGSWIHSVVSDSDVKR